MKLRVAPRPAIGNRSGDTPAPAPGLLRLVQGDTSKIVGVATSGWGVQNDGGAAATAVLAVSPADATISPNNFSVAAGAFTAFALTGLVSGSKSVSLTTSTGGASVDATSTPKGIGFTPAPSPPPPPPPGVLSRLTSTTLFSDIAASTTLSGGDTGGNIVVPARAGVAAPKTDFIVGVYGPHNDYVDLYAKWAWRNQGGDWIDANGTWQGTAAPHFTFTANSATSGSASYPGIVATEAARAAYWRGKWNAFIVKCVGGARALAALHHPSLAAPVMHVTYADTSTADLPCIACVRLTSGSAYSFIGAQQAIISNSVALEFAMPTKEVASATIDFVVSSHDATPATISGFVANPPTAAGEEEFGIAELYDEDIGISAHPSVLFAQRFTDGTVLSDYVVASPVSVDTGAFSNWSPFVYGGSDNPAKLPTAIGGAQVAGSNKWIQVNTPSPGSGFSLVDSSYTGDGFVPFGPGRGALRIVLAGSSVADGSAVGSYSGVLGSDLRYYFDKAICGNVSELYIRQELQLAWVPKTLAETKQLREVDGATARYVVPRGKLGVGPQHATPYGGNSNTGGDNLGHSDRLGWFGAPGDLSNAGSYLFHHSQDNGPARVNLPFGKDGGLGAVLFANQPITVESYIKLNTYNASGAIGTSPADGVVKSWINGVLDSIHTGVKWRDGAIDYGTTPNGPTDIAPFGTLGFTGLWLNTFQGDTLPADMDLVVFVGAIVVATQYIGRVAPALPNWVPAPGEVAVLSLANGKKTNSLRDVAAPYYHGFYLAGISAAYSGACVNQELGAYGAVVLEGGGHSTGNDNSVVLLTPGANGVTYSRATNPSPLFGTGTDTTTKDNNSQANLITAGLLDYVNYEYTVDKQPMGSHSYGDQNIVRSHHMGGGAFGTFYRTLREGGGFILNVTGAESAHRVRFDAAAGPYAYARAGTPRFNGTDLHITGGPNWSAHVPKQNRIYIEAHGQGSDRPVRWLDLTLGKYIDGTGTPLTGRTQGNGGDMVPVPWRDLVIHAERDSTTGFLKLRYMDVSTLNPSWNNTARTLSTNLAVSDNWAEITVDKRRRCLIVGNVTGDTTAVYKIAIPTDLDASWTVTRQAFGVGQSITWNAGMGYGRLDGLDKLRGTALYTTRAAQDASQDATELVYAHRFSNV